MLSQNSQALKMAVKDVHAMIKRLILIPLLIKKTRIAGKSESPNLAE